MKGQMEQSHSFLMAAKCDFLSPNIKTGNIVYISASSVKCDSEEFTASLDEDNTDNPYKCRRCLKRLLRKSHLKHHSLCHDGSEHCECGTCHKLFKQATSLKLQELHSGVKPYKSGTCHKQFTQAGNLIKAT